MLVIGRPSARLKWTILLRLITQVADPWNRFGRRRYGWSSGCVQICIRVIQHSQGYDREQHKTLNRVHDCDISAFTVLPTYRHLDMCMHNGTCSCLFVAKHIKQNWLRIGGTGYRLRERRATHAYAQALQSLRHPQRTMWISELPKRLLLGTGSIRFEQKPTIVPITLTCTIFAPC